MDKFKYIQDRYKVPAEMNREVIVGGKKGVITEDKGNYIGVNFYDNLTSEALPCHPTSEVEYLDTFNYKPPIKKMTRSQLRYHEYLQTEENLTFKEWLGIKTK